jgi:MoxR-like ATPase
VVSAADVVALQEEVRRVRVEDSLSDYVLDLITATRAHPDVYLGGSTRGALSLYRAAQALALLEGRDYAVPDDVKRLAPGVLAHRILARSYRQGGRSDTADAIVSEVLGRTTVPA